MRQGQLKKIHLPPGEESLECQCLRDGTLDVNLTTGEVFSLVGSKRKRMKFGEDRDGYLHIWLARERSDRRGKPEIEMLRNGKRVKRYRRRRYVRVNRLVKMKALAVALGGDQWRKYVADLPRGVDVNHTGARNDNRAHKLTLETERANRTRSEMTPEEQAEINACPF
jgi:hypothetical protein